MIILKVTKKQSFALTLEGIFLGKPQWERGSEFTAPPLSVLLALNTFQQILHRDLRSSKNSLWKC